MHRESFYEGNVRVQIVDPTGWKSTTSRALAPRPSSLEGLVIGLLDNNKPGAKELFSGLEPKLREMGAADVVYRQKSHPSAPSPYVTEVAERADVVLSALGD